MTGLETSVLEQLIIFFALSTVLFTGVLIVIFVGLFDQYKTLKKKITVLEVEIGTLGATIFRQNALIEYFCEALAKTLEEEEKLAKLLKSSKFKKLAEFLEKASKKLKELKKKK